VAGYLRSIMAAPGVRSAASWRLVQCSLRATVSVVKLADGPHSPRVSRWLTRRVELGFGSTAVIGSSCRRWDDPVAIRCSSLAEVPHEQLPV
jgi:hypothetical protein